MLRPSRATTTKALVITAASLLLLATFYLVNLYNYRLPAVGDALGSAKVGLVKTAPPLGAPKNPPIMVLNSAPEGIPEKIWYKLRPNGLTEEANNRIITCSDQNPRHRVELMTDESSDAYATNVFASRPDIVEIYLNLTVPILRADLLRYLLLYAEGGMWSDLDVSCEKVPIADWVPPEFRDRAELIVGWEFDAGFGPNVLRQFASWTILAKPGLPHMQQVIEDIIEAVHITAALYKVPVAGLDMRMVGDVVDFTGPRRFTRGTLKSLQRSLGHEVDMAAISDIRQPKLVDNVLILPGFAFANLTNSYDEGEVAGPVLVTQ